MATRTVVATGATSAFGVLRVMRWRPSVRPVTGRSCSVWFTGACDRTFATVFKHRRRRAREELQQLRHRGDGAFVVLLRHLDEGGREQQEGGGPVILPVVANRRLPVPRLGRPPAGTPARAVR